MIQILKRVNQKRITRKGRLYERNRDVNQSHAELMTVCLLTKVEAFSHAKSLLSKRLPVAGRLLCYKTPRL